MNHVSVLRASFRENRKRAQYKSGNQVLQITKAVNYEGRIAEDATVHGDAGCGEKRPANNNCDANLISHNMKPSTEGQAVSPDAPLNPLWKDSHIRAHFPGKRPNGTFDNGPLHDAGKALLVSGGIWAGLIALYWIVRRFF